VRSLTVIVSLVLGVKGNVERRSVRVKLSLGEKICIKTTWRRRDRRTHGPLCHFSQQPPWAEFPSQQILALARILRVQLVLMAQMAARRVE